MTSEEFQVSTINFTGGLVGTLPDLARHDISGNVYIVDSKTILIENFNYDATAPGNNIIKAM